VGVYGTLVSVTVGVDLEVRTVAAFLDAEHAARSLVTTVGRWVFGERLKADILNEQRFYRGIEGAQTWLFLVIASQSSTRINLSVSGTLSFRSGFRVLSSSSLVRLVPLVAAEPWPPAVEAAPPSLRRAPTDSDWRHG